jgi:hypothetical protein
MSNARASLVDAKLRSALCVPVVQDSGRQRLFLQGAIAAEYQDRMFMLALDRNGQRMMCMNLQVSTDLVCRPKPRPDRESVP